MFLPTGQLGIATNDLYQSSVDPVEFESQTRWKIEEFHREIKQLTGIQFCQCRLWSIGSG